MPATLEYERNRLARVARNRAEGAAPLAYIQKIAGQLVYGGSGHDKQRRKGEDAGSASEYEPNDDEEDDDADEVSGEEEEHEPTLLLSKEKQASTKPQGRKRTRSKPAVPTTTRTTRASTSKPNQTEQTPSNGNDTSPHQTSKDSNSPQADTEMQHSQDMTNTSQGTLVRTIGPTNPETSKRGKRRPTMGHGLLDYAKRNGGRKMKIDFSAGRVKPLDPVQAAKLASQCGIHVRSHRMHVATHWKDYNEEGLDHHIPKAIGHVAKHFEMDPKEELSRSVCTNIHQKGIRNQRYRLKKNYFNGRTAEEALANKPPNLSQENWEALVNKWSDQRNKEICQKNKDNREAVKHQQTTGSRSYPSHFHQITAMQDKRSEAQPEDEQPVSDTQIVAEVLKEHSSSSTFLSTMGYQSRSGRSRTSASAERVRELEERVEKQKIEAIEAREMYQQQLSERVKAQEAALEEMRKKQEQELEALKKSQEEKMNLLYT